METRF